MPETGGAATAGSRRCRAEGRLPSVRLALSAILVFGLFGLLIAAATADDPTKVPVPVDWLIHERIPVAMLAILAAGAVLGLTSRARGWIKFPVVALEVAAAGLLTFYFTSQSFVPVPAPRIAVGDRFPSWTLPDQDGVVRRYVAEGLGETSAAPHPGRALYLFYRGDW